MNNAPTLLATPFIRKDGSIYYFWLMDMGRVIELGHAQDGREVSDTLERLKKRYGYINLKTNKIPED